ncbi:MAG: RNA-binding domain-containing protein [Xenococcus sp. (in: cyanobacteria)]
MKQQIIFIKGETFPQEEGDSVEFKEITSKNPVKTILNHSEKYVPGYLNAQIEGNLYLGVDDSGIIQGVTLNRNDRDEIKRDIANKLKDTDPPIPYTYYKVSIHNVLNPDGESIQDLCVVKIHITKTTKPRFPYRTSGGSVYFKKGSSCPKLNSEEITTEIERRSQIHLQKEASKIDKKLEKNPNDSNLLKKRAEIAKYLSDVETMDRAYQKLLELNPKDSNVRIQYATAHEKIGDLEGALSILDEALQSGIDKLSILQSRGAIFLHLDDWNNALYSYREALKLKPDDYTIITQIGVLFRQLGEYKKSVKFLNYALSKSPNYRVAKYEKKKTYYEIFKAGV